MPDSNPGQRSVDLETLDEDTLGDELEGGDLLEDTVVESLVEGDGVLGLVLDLSLGPLLLLGGFSSRGDGGFGFGLIVGVSTIHLETVASSPETHPAPPLENTATSMRPSCVPDSDLAWIHSPFCVVAVGGEAGDDDGAFFGLLRFRRRPK
jgi:hypothetical protein